MGAASSMGKLLVINTCFSCHYQHGQAAVVKGSMGKLL